MALYLNEDEVRRTLTMEDALAAVEDAFKEQGLGVATNMPRVRLRSPRVLPPALGATPGGAIMNLMAAALPGMGVVGYKAYTVTRTGVRFQVFLYSLETGEMLAILEANALGQQRTGAASGIATKYLAREDAATLGVIGGGFQAQAQVQAVCAVRPIREVRVFSRRPEQREAFARQMGELVGVPVIAAASGEEAVRDAAVVCTITSSREPVLLGKWLARGSHVNAAGSNSLLRAELDEEAVRRADRILVDDMTQARAEAGDLLGPTERGTVTWAQMGSLADVVAGRAPGRTSPDEITLFVSQGLAAWDVATAARVYQKAKAAGLGQPLPFS
ncbi:MAG: ornithine cyclodeaminase family protein [Chloroflexi bacterium]|nr:ornithine cyclodeaminase family protein [Chloroflexota bacterium]